MLVVVVFSSETFKRETSDLNDMFTLIIILYLSPSVQGLRNLGLGEPLGLPAHRTPNLVSQSCDLHIISPLSISQCSELADSSLPNAWDFT